MDSTILLAPITNKLNLLILESNDNITNKYNRLFEELFQNIHKTHSQKEANNIIQKQHIDIIILDIEIHDIEPSFMFIKALRDENPLIKVIVYSYRIDQDILLKSINYSVSGFIWEQSNINDMKSAIKNCVDKILITANNTLSNFISKEITIDNCLNFLLNDKHGSISLINHFKGLVIQKVQKYYFMKMR